MDETDDHEPAALTGEDLRRMRRRAGLSQQQLAERFGCDRTTIVRWEQGHRYRGGRERVAYPIPDEVRTHLLVVIAQARAERRQLDHEIGRRVQALASA